jgi:L-amino acid N-acyltransferase YncA
LISLIEPRPPSSTHALRRRCAVGHAWNASVTAVAAATLILRPACAEDAEQLAAIWNHEARATLTTTDTEVRDATAQRAWLATHSARYPIVVAVTDDEVTGYAALTAYRMKPAFQRTVEDSVYVDRRWRGRGVGRLLVTHVLDQAAALGHHSVFARITAENAASRRLHEQLGFRLVGIEEEVAFKLARWLDVAVYQRRL